jgi:hypothetical protein
MHLFNTKSGNTRVLHVPGHGLEPQVAITGRGRGQYTIEEGHPQIHKAVLELLKYDIVWRVDCNTDYFMITVSDPRRWPEIEGVIHHTVARTLEKRP